VLIFLPPTVITGLANAVVTRTARRSERHAVTHLETAAHNFADGTSRWFAIGYLLLHAVIKIGLVAALLRKIVPVYPVAAVVSAHSSYTRSTVRYGRIPSRCRSSRYSTSSSSCWCCGNTDSYAGRPPPKAELSRADSRSRRVTRAIPLDWTVDKQGAYFQASPPRTSER